MIKIPAKKGANNAAGTAINTGVKHDSGLDEIFADLKV